MSSFGGFTNDGSEYVFTSYRTPRPMMNYVWNSKILAGINQTGGGLRAYGNRTLSYIDPEGKGRSVVVKDGNRYFYIRDEESSQIWSPGWYPVKNDLDHYECTHGLGYSLIEGAKDDIHVQAKVFVNDEDPVEIWTLNLKNTSNRQRKIKIYSFVEYALNGYKVYCNYYSNLQSCFDEKNNVLVAFNTAQERTHDWFNGFIASSLPVTGYESSKKEFLGNFGDIHSPVAVIKGECTNSMATCEDMVGVLENTIVLQSNSSAEFKVLIGATDSVEEAVRVSKRLFKEGKTDKDFEALKSSQKDMIHDIEIKTPDEKINNLINKWIKTQIQFCAEVGRDTGKGFRDQLQDAWAVASFDQKLAKEKILETLKYQYSDGRCVRGWLPLDPHIYSDGPTWIAPTVNAYVKETGDVDFLDISVTYLDEGEATVWEHVLKAVRYSSEDLGVHDLVKAHDGDWNDSLNGIGVGGKGESVWTSIALYYALQNVIEIALKVLKSPTLVEEMSMRAEKIKKAVNESGWDGQWFLAGYTDTGEKVGSHLEKEGSIYLNSQTWAIMSNILNNKKQELCLKALDDQLDSPYGPLTLYPTYTKYNPAIGRLTGFVPGIWENGTPYCHGGTFKIVSDCCIGRGDEAFDTLMKIMPDSENNPSDISGCEPYVLTNMYFGPDNPRAGETMFGWVTGTAGWMFRAVTQFMMGFHPGHDGIEIKPCIPSKWKVCHMKRKFRNAVYDLEIINNGKGNHVKSITVDGRFIDGSQIPIFGDNKVHQVLIEID